MTTAATPTASTEAPSLSSSVSGLLEILFGDGGGQLVFTSRTEDGIGMQEFRLAELERAELERGWLPIQILVALEDGWCIHVTPALKESAGPRPVQLSALFTRWMLEPERTRHGWMIPEEMATAIAEKLKAFPLPPSALIDGANEVVPVWRLERSLDLRAGLKSALELQRRLAVALGASTKPIRHITTGRGAAGIHDVQELAAHDPRLPIPLAGVVRGWDGAPPLVTIPVCDATCTYPLAEIERALVEKENQ